MHHPITCGHIPTIVSLAVSGLWVGLSKIGCIPQLLFAAGHALIEGGNRTLNSLVRSGVIYITAGIDQTKEV
jgi:hypothetical protein